MLPHLLALIVCHPIADFSPKNGVAFEDKMVSIDKKQG